MRRRNGRGGGVTGERCQKRKLHALVLGWPEDNVVRLPLLARDNRVGRGTVERITLPGSDAPLRFRRTAEALEVDVPAERRNDIGVALILSGAGLTEGSVA